jgi:hypothetical protein
MTCWRLAWRWLRPEPTQPHGECGPRAAAGWDGTVGPGKVSAPRAMPSTNGKGLLSWKPSAANSKGCCRSTPRRRWPRRHRSDRAFTSVAQQRANARKTRLPRPTAGTPHGVHPRQSWEKLTRNRRSPLTGRSTSMLPMTGLPSSTGFIHACSAGPCRIWRRRPGQDRQTAADAIRNPSRGYGRMRRMRQSRLYGDR